VLTSLDIRSLKNRPLNQYSRKLLRDLGASGVPGEAIAGEHPARQLAESGLMVLAASEVPVLCPVPLTDCANGALNAFRALAATDVLPGVTGAELLTERAAIKGTQVDDTAGAHCRLLATLDGTIGLNLTRTEDWELLPAWLETQGAADWSGVELLVLNKTSQVLLERGRLLGLAVADVGEIPTTPNSWMTVASSSGPVVGRRTGPRVLDLSSLWAGPLCSALWQAAGAEVVKIEGARRPDGARAGSREFFDLLNKGKNCITLDLHRQAGHRALLDLIKQSDIVLEASRPRALRHMGIIAEELIEEVPGLTWVSITGYGRSEPQQNWIAYGDDAGVSAGLSAILHDVCGQWLVYGDAIADPLTGLHAALAGWASWTAGGGQLLELSLEQTVRHCITATAPPGNDYRGRQQRWKEYLESHNISPSQPRRRNEALSSEQS
jgi:hypothetical protein